ncbi:MAG: UDP-N-acetylmuramoyl-L-alanyl-D-glutamate--2,6-diaminopimelate ligase [Actinobacteria bacterium]|nr:UDP-N-acetylmuramoyl-L-alanyl-D-glutamate--2,6-diaminopimelate ligase [Actinomycetota bacterium]
MRLDELLDGVDVLELRGDAAVDVRSVTHDSAQVTPGALFCCVPGTHVDGHDFADQAVAAGAVALLVERALPLDVSQVRVADVRAAMGPVAAAAYGHPSRWLTVVGVTGTNGKTTTTHFLRGIFEANGWAAGTIGTLDGARTTPEAPVLQATLASMRDNGQRAAAVEVSSHALAQRRVDGVHFAAVVFTNLSQDHLDYHGTMEDYFAAKATLFDPDRADVAIVNADDPYGRRLLEDPALRTVPYARADATGVTTAADRARFTWRGVEVQLAVGGEFNIDNALAAATTAAELGIDPEIIARGVEDVTIPGRYEAVHAGQPFPVIVDYAHTPDGLEQLLLAARRDVRGGRLFVVFGAGGDRDAGKRPQMGAVAARLADVAILTSDNPRHEDPLDIIGQVQAGAPSGELLVEPDRRSAIASALRDACDGDVVVIAGKGHEQGQDFGDRVVPFDDRDVAREVLSA